MDDSNDLSAELERLRKERAERKLIDDEMARRRRERAPARVDLDKARREREESRIEVTELLDQFRDDQQNRLKRQRLVGLVLGIAASPLGVLLIWIGSQSSGFVSELFNTLGGATLVTATISVAASLVSYLVNAQDRALLRQERANVEAILARLDDFAFKFESVGRERELNERIEELDKLEEKRARTQVRLNEVNEVDPKSEVSRRLQRRFQESFQTSLTYVDSQINELYSRQSIFDSSSF